MILREIACILKSPIDNSLLILMDKVEVEKINKKISQNVIHTINGEKVNDEIEAGYISQDANYIFPIRDGIILLLKEGAIVINNTKKIFNCNNLASEVVKRYYDQLGWKKEPNGNYIDAAEHEELRKVAKNYVHECHLRMGNYLSPGKYLLDVASGPIQYQEYLKYSEKYSHRICVDFSLIALKEAKKKLGEKGIYILADITNLPFKNGSIDTVISLHTIYHVHSSKQLKAFDEIYRILKPGSNGVVVYSWGSKSILMNILQFPYKMINKICSVIPGSEIYNKRRALYFYTYGPNFLLAELKKRYKITLLVWRMISVDFIKRFIYRELLGEKILRLIFKLEEIFPGFFGYIGQYPIIVLHKEKI